VWAYRQGGNPGLAGDAESAYRASSALFEMLVAETPNDREAWSWYADALGEWGLGWFLMMSGKTAEAEPNYRQAIDISRKLALDSGADLPSMSFELEKMARLTGTLASLLEASGGIQELRERSRDLIAACKTLTPRLYGPGGSVTCANLAQTLAQISSIPQMQREGKKECEDLFRLSIRLHPKNDAALNNLAWHFSTDPGASAHDRAEALDAASKATNLVPTKWGCWNTLGVAAYRAGDWKRAKEALEKSMSLHGGGDAFDWYFLAMTFWHQQDPVQARKWFDQAKAWTKANQPQNAELQRFQVEAEALLKQDEKALGSKKVANN
jgi:tetratricopeptide (TPR) repeat protein